MNRGHCGILFSPQTRLRYGRIEWQQVPSDSSCHDSGRSSQISTNSFSTILLMSFKPVDSTSLYRKAASIHSLSMNVGYHETGRRHSRESSIERVLIYVSIPPLVVFWLARHGVDSRRLTPGSYMYTKPVRVPVTSYFMTRFISLSTHSSYTISHKVLGQVL